MPRSAEADADGRHEGRYSSSKSGSATFGGWSDAGLLRFEALIMDVKRARRQKHCAKVEEEILKRLRTDVWKMAEDDNGGGGKKKAKKKESKVTLSFSI